MEPHMKVTFPGGLRVDAEYKGFQIQTDQPVYAGGEGSAPAPFDLFLASIATCAGIYILSFCAKRGIPSEDISLTMRLEKDPSARLIERIDLDIHLPKEFPEKYTHAVVKAVNGCSVKAHLLKPPEIKITPYIGS